MVKFCFWTSITTYILSDHREMLVLDVHLRGVWASYCIRVIRCVIKPLHYFAFGSYLSWHLRIITGSLKLTDMNEHFEGFSSQGTWRGNEALSLSAPLGDG